MDTYNLEELNIDAPEVELKCFCGKPAIAASFMNYKCGRVICTIDDELDYGFHEHIDKAISQYSSYLCDNNPEYKPIIAENHNPVDGKVSYFLIPLCAVQLMIVIKDVFKSKKVCSLSQKGVVLILTHSLNLFMSF